MEPGQQDLADFLANYHVDVVASLPCYLQENVDTQRGKGVFAASIDGLRALNQLGYGKSDSGLSLDLVYNPQGATLPPPQQALNIEPGSWRSRARYAIWPSSSDLPSLAYSSS